MLAVLGASWLMEVMSQKHKQGLLTGNIREEATPELSPLHPLVPVRRVFILNEEREKRILEESDPMPSDLPTFSFYKFQGSQKPCRAPWVQILALPLMSCVTASK